MKKTLFLAAIIFCSFFAFAQNELLVQSSDKGMFLSHKIVAKENFFSVGRLYNIAPKDIAAFNGLDMAHGLVIGQTVKIPLNASNFSQSTTNGRPVYYVVGAKEGLYRVSLKNNNVLMAELRKWNHLSNDNISTGQKLVVGYLVSPEANNIVQTHTEPEKKQVIEEPKKEVVIEKQDPVVLKKEEKKEETASVQKTEDDSKNKSVPVTDKKTASSNTVKQAAVTDASGGYFKQQFDQQVKVQTPKNDESASAGIFKTASGWQDAKYYALMDKVEPGTIVKIVNPTNNKAIYAKVLGEVSGIRQNQGYDVRISNAAASALDVSDTDKFIVRVNY
jgi:LysM repeat protein